MKFLRVADAGRDKPCLPDANGTARDISHLVADTSPLAVPTLPGALRGIEAASLPAVNPDKQRIGSPMAHPANICCIGRNHSDRAAEADMAIRSEPMLFSKASATFCGPDDSSLCSPKTTRLDRAVEPGIGGLGDQSQIVQPL